MTGGALLILLFCAGACYAQDKNVVELAVATPSLSKLVEAVKAADLAITLSGAGPFTVFAPTDAAFAALPAGVLTDLLKPENKSALAGLLTMHVISGSIKAGDLKDSQDVETLVGVKVNIVKRDGGVYVNGAKVVQADVIGSNGVVHIIDKVISPNIVQLAVATPSLSTLVEAVTAADLAGTLSGAGPFTVFAPTKAAFDALPTGELANLLKPANKVALQGLLKLHVISGSIKAGDLKDSQDVETLTGVKVNIVKRDGGVYVNGAKVVQADVTGWNGVVHIIDKVILPPAAAPVGTVSPGKTSDSSSTRASALFAMASLLLLALAHH
jgi:uncharacterized surface protein with fasciclin (FAS1) repeats